MEETTNNTESMSIVSRMVNVYTNPSKSFTDLGSYKNWLIPLLIIIVVASGRQFIMQDLEMKMVKERIERNEKIPEQQKAVIIEQMEAGANSPGKMAQSFGGIVFVTFLFALIAGGLYLFTGNVVFGGSATYSSMLSVYALGSLIFIPEYIVKSALALSKGSAQIYTSLAILLDPAESSTFLFTFLNWIDIFSIWKLAVWAIGFGVVYKFNQTKSWINVLTWYLLGLLVFYGINSLTGGMLG